MKNFGKRTENLDFANIGDIPTKLSQLTNDAGYLTVGTLPTNLVTTDKAQTITGLKTFNAPANISGTEQSTAIFKTSNGGQLIVGKEGANSGTMLRFDQVAGTVRLRFRASATAGAMVWEQPEQGAQLYIDLGKSGADYRRITFPSVAGTLALTSQVPSAPNNGILTIQKNGTTIATFGANQSDNKTANITVPVKVSELTNDSGYTNNTGTVTSVAIKMNGSTKGTVTNSGTIDLGTVITDVSGKLDKTENTGISVLGATKKTTTLGGNQLYAPNGIIFGGTAAAAGLVTRGICGVNVPGNGGACAKDDLYVNYDGNNDYSRKLVLGAGSVGDKITVSIASSGTDYGNMYSAIRGDQMVRYVNAKIPTDYLIGGSQTTTSTADGGSNIFTFTKANGQTATFTVKNGSKGSTGKDGENGLDALVYNNVIFVDNIPEEESKGNMTLNSNDFNRLPYPDETFWVIMSDDSGAEEAVQFNVDSYGANTETVSCGWLNRRNIKGEQGQQGDDGVGISTATTGTPTVSTDGYTTTPITFRRTDNTTILVNVKAKNGKDGTNATITSIDGLKGGTLTSPLIITGGDQATAAKIALNQAKNGQITDSSTSTIFGFMNSGALTVGATAYTINIRGKNTRPTYNGNNLALFSDIPTVNNAALTIKVGKNGDVSGTGTFTANQSTASTITLPVYSKDDVDTEIAKCAKLSGDNSFTGNITIGGNLTVNGTTTTVDSTTLQVKDKLIMVAYGNTTKLTTPAGLVAPKYDGTNSGALVFDGDGIAYVGDVVLDSNGNINVSQSGLQTLATRTGLVGGNIVKYDSTNLTLVDSGIAANNIATLGANTFSGGQTITGTRTDGYSVFATGYIRGSWLQAPSTGQLSSTPTKICVLDGGGWLYYRTPAEIRTDIGAAATADIPTVNNGKLTIKQGGVEKGSFTANQSGNVEIDLESGGTTHTTYTAIHMSYSEAVDTMNGDPIEDFTCKLWISPLRADAGFTVGSDFLSWLGANMFADETSALACNGYSPQLGAACACWGDGSNILYVEFANGQIVMLYADSITISENSFMVSV